jgi:endonuclease YncB( thermonuclease family)
MKKLILILYSLFIIFSINAHPSFSATPFKFIKGKIKVIDGDTIKINRISIRLFGIDAPEKNQICTKKSKNYNCGTVATKFLKQYVGKKKITCRFTEKDRYGRIIGICYFTLDNTKFSLNRYMVHNGHAVAYRRYSEKYLDSEKWAKVNKLGIWQGNFERPEKWRRKYK